MHARPELPAGADHHHRACPHPEWLVEPRIGAGAEHASHIGGGREALAVDAQSRQARVPRVHRQRHTGPAGRAEHDETEGQPEETPKHDRIMTGCVL